MKYSYIIIDDDPESILRTKAVAESFQNLRYIDAAHTYNDGLNLILEHQPAIVFLEIEPTNKTSDLSLLLINELYRYLKVLPRIIITTTDRELAYDALKYEVLDYLTKPLQAAELRRTVLKFEKTMSTLLQFTQPTYIIPAQTGEVSIQTEIQKSPEPEAIEAEIQEEGTIFENADKEINRPIIGVVTHAEEKPLIICVKSYGDYRFIEAKDICYLQADNNSTDIHLYNGEMITAFKTLKHFEGVLMSPFVRIHNSYIVNIDYVSRIHTGNSVCYIKNTTTKLPFSKSYKENVDSIINSITNGNYLEI